MPLATTNAKGNLAVKRSVARVIVLYILTLGLYGLYWFYVSREQVTKELGTNDSAGWQTVGLIVPILNFFIYYWLLRDIDVLQRKARLDGFSAGGYLSIIIAASLLSWIPIFGWALAIGAVVIMGLVVAKLNEYWDTKTNGKATEAPIAGGEVAVIAIGVAFWAAMILLVTLGAFSGSAELNY